MGESRHTSSLNKTDYYYTLDHLGSVREMLNSTGTIQAAYEYTPYGKRTKVGGAMDVDFGYTGHWHHTESGLYLALYRAYDPTLGRWLSMDPIGEAGGVNLYGYVGNQPTFLVDPYGLHPDDVLKGIGSAVRGNFRNVIHGGASLGLGGRKRASEEMTDGMLLLDAMDLYWRDECFRSATNEALKEFLDYLSNEKGVQSAARLGTGVTLSKLVWRGWAFGAGAANGDLRHAFRRHVTQPLRNAGFTEGDLRLRGAAAVEMAASVAAAILGADAAVHIREFLAR